MTELLKAAIENGIIDLTVVEQQVIEMERKHYLDAHLYQICEKLNMPVRSPHKIRKTYGSILLDNDVNSKIIEKQMGHAGINVTKEYYYRDRSTTSEKRAAINSVRQFALNTTLNTTLNTMDI